MTGDPGAAGRRTSRLPVGPVAALSVGYLVVALLLLEVMPAATYALTVAALGIALALSARWLGRPVAWLRFAVPDRDIELPLEAVLGFAWLLVGMLANVYVAYHRTRRRLTGGASRAHA